MRIRSSKRGTGSSGRSSNSDTAAGGRVRMAMVGQRTRGQGPEGDMGEIPPMGQRARRNQADFSQAVPDPVDRLTAAGVSFEPLEQRVLDRGFALRKP